MVKEEIRILKGIVHILDINVGMAVLSDSEMELGEDLRDYLREHIFKIASGDESKRCEFYRKESQVFAALQEYDDLKFVDFSKMLAEGLFDIMHANVEIPCADLFVVRFMEGGRNYIAILKMNYKEFYTHRTQPVESGNFNEVIKHRSILPAGSARISEGAIISLEDFSVSLVEKKYEINGEKENYFSYLFLKCTSDIPQKTKLSIVTRAIANVQKNNLEEKEQFEETMKAKAIIEETLKEEGSFTPEVIAEKVFADHPILKDEFQEQMEKYNMVREEVAPICETTVRKYEKQSLTTDTGIELKIPMEQYKDPDSVEFITNADGTVSILIKNIEHIEAKY